jgi:hypothetical protein
MAASCASVLSVGSVVAGSSPVLTSVVVSVDGSLIASGHTFESTWSVTLGGHALGGTAVTARRSVR